MTEPRGQRARRYLPRALSEEQATALVGSKAESLPVTQISPGTVVCDAHTEEPILGYFSLRDAARLRRAVLTIDTTTGVQRQSNYRSKSRTFGYAPRRPVVRRESCQLTSLGRDHPEVERVLEDYADQFSDMLVEIDPAIVPRDIATLGPLLRDWRIGEAKLWTSGVVNDTATLPYHRDGFNFPTWSAMPVLRRGIRGGGLHLPEYGLVVPCADATVTLFQGQRFVHGVTPMTRVRPKEGYRISIVYYALKGMKNCREAAEEAAYGSKRRTEREIDMARRLAAGDRSIPGNTDPIGALKRMHGSLAREGFNPENGTAR